MKRLTLSTLILFFSLLSSNLIAQTNVEGIFSNDQTWSLAGSPYTLSNDVQFENGATLTIEAGVEIYYSTDFVILIQSAIVANGTNELPIVFNSVTQSGLMIMFKNTNLSDSSFSYVKFIGPRRALQLAEETESNPDSIKNSGTLNVSNCSFTNTDILTKGYETTAHLKFENSSFDATEIIGGDDKTEAIELINCEITNSTLFSETRNYGIILNNCDVFSSIIKVDGHGANFDIIESQIVDSSIEPSFESQVYGPIKITDSNIKNTPMNLPRTRVELTGSIVEYNELKGLVCGNGLVECSQITGDGDGIAVEVTGYNGSTFGETFAMNNSTLTENSLGLRVLYTEGLTVGSSNFYSNSTYHLENLSNVNLLATNNWWGTSDETEIEDKIRHYTDDNNLGLVDYSNHLNAEVDLSFCLNILSNGSETGSSINKATIYPNPSNGKVNIGFENMSEISMTVYNISGQLIYQVENINTNLHSFVLDGASGMYLVEIVSSGQKQYYQLIKK